MEVLDLVQGTPEWLAVKADHDSASESPAMMGADIHGTTRADLLREKATGVRKEPTPFQQRIFDRGHAAEAACRPLAEAVLGEDLYPIVCRDGRYLASLDGCTLDGDTIWEHKIANIGLVGAMSSGDASSHDADCETVDQDAIDEVSRGTVPAPHYWQLEHQLWVSGASRAMFSVSNGTTESHVWTWYRSQPERRAALIAGWEQFERDLAEYAPEPDYIKPVVPVQERLPALVIDLAGDVRSSNLATFSDAAIARIEAIRTDLQTDEDFAEAESVVVFLGKAEKEIDAAKARALSQTENIDALFRAVDALRETMRAKRLELDKLVKARKVSIRAEIIEAGAARVREHLASINAAIIRAPVRCNPIPDLQAAAKGKRSLKGLRDAVDQAVADIKIATGATAVKIANNLNAFDAEAREHSALFPDLADLAHKDHEDFLARARERIAKAEAEAEARRQREIERQAEAKRQAEAQEEARRQREAARQAEAQRRAEEAERVRAEAAAKAAEAPEEEPVETAKVAPVKVEPAKAEPIPSRPAAAPIRLATRDGDKISVRILGDELWVIDLDTARNLVDDIIEALGDE